MVLLFINISTVTLTNKLIKKVKNLLKALPFEVLFTGPITLLNDTQSFWYDESCVIQTAAGKINKTPGSIYI